MKHYSPQNIYYFSGGNINFFLLLGTSIFFSARGTTYTQPAQPAHHSLTTQDFTFRPSPFTLIALERRSCPIVLFVKQECSLPRVRWNDFKDFQESLEYLDIVWSLFMGLVHACGSERTKDQRVFLCLALLVNLKMPLEIVSGCLQPNLWGVWTGTRVNWEVFTFPLTSSFDLFFLHGFLSMCHLFFLHG